MDENKPLDKDSQNSPETRQMIAIPVDCLPLGNQSEDEIDLRELLNVLVKRKWLIAATTALAIGFGIIYAFFLARPAYEARATVEIGHYLTQNGRKTENTPVYFGNRTVIKKYLNTKYHTAGKYRTKAANAYLSKVSLPKGEENRCFFTLTALGSSNVLATRALQAPLKDIFNQHNIFYKAILQKKKDAIESLEKRLSNKRKIVLPQLKAEVKILEEVDLKRIENQIIFLQTREIPTTHSKIREYEKEISQKEALSKELRRKLDKLLQKDAAMATMIALQIANLQNDIANLRIKIIDLQTRIKEINESDIMDLRAQKRRLTEMTIPQKKAEITRLLETTIPKLQNQIKQLKLEIQPPFLTRTKVVGKIRTHNHPVKPRKKLIVALAGIMGLMLGVFLAFGREFLSPKSAVNSTEIDSPDPGQAPGNK